MPAIEANTLAGEPSVTLVVAMRNEAANIERCVASILAQDYPVDRLEIWVLDGGSTDGSADLVRSLVAGRSRWHVAANPRGIQAAAWNVGIRNATGDVVGILSGHSEIGVGYVRAAVATLRRTGADMVGGPVRAISDGAVGRAVATAISTPFGVGGATFRYLDREAEVDTVFMGLCKTETYLRFPFDEEMVRNQDDELSYRLLDAGARIVCSPSIQSAYRSRATIPGLWRQYLDYGRWKVRVIQKHPRQVRARHLVPTALVLGLVGLGLATVIWAPAVVAFLALAGIYLAAVLVASAIAARGLDLRSALVLPLVYPVLHLSYGAGFLLGLVRFRGAWGPGSLRVAVTSLVRRASS